MSIFLKICRAIALLPTNCLLLNQMSESHRKLYQQLNLCIMISEPSPTYQLILAKSSQHQLEFFKGILWPHIGLS